MHSYWITLYCVYYVNGPPPSLLYSSKKIINELGQNLSFKKRGGYVFITLYTFTPVKIELLKTTWVRTGYCWAHGRMPPPTPEKVKHFVHKKQTRNGIYFSTECGEFI